MADADLEAWFNSAGGVARTCLKRAHGERLDRGKWLEDVSNKLTGIKGQDLMVCQPTLTWDACKMLAW